MAVIQPTNAGGKLIPINTIRFTGGDRFDDPGFALAETQPAPLAPLNVSGQTGFQPEPTQGPATPGPVTAANAVASNTQFNQSGGNVFNQSRPGTINIQRISTSAPQPSAPAPQPSAPAPTPSALLASTGSSQPFTRGAPLLQGAEDAPEGISVDRNIRDVQAMLEINPTAAFFFWLVRVREFGPQDYKRTVGYDYASFGNFNYGATGRALGFSVETLQRFAGAVGTFMSPLSGVEAGGGGFFGHPPYGDRPEDYWDIMRGAAYFDQRFGRPKN